MKTNIRFALLTLAILPLAAVAENPPIDVILIDHAKVAGAFSQGLPLLANDRYKIHASRRVVPGVVEVHEHDTDIFYVLEGVATMVTGGTMVEPKSTGPGEIRANSSTGGVSQHLTKGDVLVIPKGVPHWFKEVSGTCLYFVVKVTD